MNICNLANAITKGKTSGEILVSLSPYIDGFINQAIPPLVPSDVYSRTILYSDDKIEMMLAGWRSKEPSWPHDHGQSHGKVVILSGVFVEKKYSFSSQGLDLRNKQNHVGPALLTVLPKEIHSMACVEGKGVTLHVYSPNIRGMRSYDIENSSTYTVVDDCGAWKPRPDQIIKTDLWGN